MPGIIGRFIDPDVDRHLLVNEGEYVIDEVAKHWIVLVAPTIAMVLASLLFISTLFAQRWWGIPFVMGIMLAIWGVLRFHLDHMDRFVITNMRVFRVHGIFDQHLATMPMTRILDISVEQPFLGRVLGYGHFVFESAAQDQGLREITYVGHPEDRDLTIQRVIQMAGLRTNLAHPK
ncbi:PH domain-containing protein [Cutibacterium equinum]|uniref:PH domain-containing protein n=1 Tax=Cutibacterium equinum TaxID=3016342 RepID=A0ABY7R200_9ACTN|nr:PH domain-containing protein [Cutibacterium equinum]WCC80817.1 PH domain-containing protein [Cutibacterium equinum]